MTAIAIPTTSNIALGQDAAAQAATDKLLADYSGNQELEHAVYYIADYYRKFFKHEQANQYYQHVLDHRPHTELAMWSSMGMAISCMALGNWPAAHAATQNLLTEFSEDAQIPQAIFNILR